MLTNSFKITNRKKTFKIRYSLYCRALSVSDEENRVSEFFFEKEEEFCFVYFYYTFKSDIPHYEKIELFGKIKRGLFPKVEEVKVGQIYEYADGSRVIVARIETEQFCLIRISGRGRDVGFRVSPLVEKIEEVFGTTYLEKDKGKLISTF